MNDFLTFKKGYKQECDTTISKAKQKCYQCAETKKVTGCGKFKNTLIVKKHYGQKEEVQIRHNFYITFTVYHIFTPFQMS